MAKLDIVLKNTVSGDIEDEYENEDEYDVEEYYRISSSYSSSSSKTVRIWFLFVINLDEGKTMRRSRRTGLGAIFGM